MTSIHFYGGVDEIGGISFNQPLPMDHPAYIHHLCEDIPSPYPTITKLIIHHLREDILQIGPEKVYPVHTGEGRV